jgi:hypothetical protein
LLLGLIQFLAETDERLAVHGKLQQPWYLSGLIILTNILATMWYKCQTKMILVMIKERVMQRIERLGSMDTLSFNWTVQELQFKKIHA